MLVPRQAYFVHQSGREIFDDNVHFVDELPINFLPARIAYIERDAFFIAVPVAQCAVEPLYRRQHEPHRFAP